MTVMVLRPPYQLPVEKPRKIIMTKRANWERSKISSSRRVYLRIEMRKIKVTVSMYPRTYITATELESA